MQVVHMLHVSHGDVRDVAVFTTASNGSDSGSDVT